MAGGYDKAGQSAYDILDQLLNNFYPDLVECKLTVGIMLVYPEQPDKPPLLLSGYPVSYNVRKTAAKDRVQGMPDLMIYLDSQAWSNYSDVEKQSTLDKCLHRFEITRDKQGHIKTDKAMRPLLKPRPVDYLVEGYNLHIRRYGSGGIDLPAIEALSLNCHTLLPINSPGQDDELADQEDVADQEDLADVA